MRYAIDISVGNFFTRVDFYESMIMDFHASLVLPETLEFTVWGAILMLSSKTYGTGPKNWSPFPDMTDNLYVAGVGKVRMTKLTGGKIKVHYCDPIRNNKGHIDLIKRKDGSDITSERIWLPKGNQGGDEYLWGCSIVWPYGSCELELYSDCGTVTYEFDDEDMIPYLDYLSNPLKYCYNGS